MRGKKIKVQVEKKKTPLLLAFNCSTKRCVLGKDYAGNSFTHCEYLEIRKVDLTHVPL